MGNILTEFTKNNITEIILGLAIGIILVLLLDLGFEEGMVIIILGPLVAIVLNNILKAIVPNEKNQRTAFILLALIGGFVAMQQFNVGVFSLDNINAESFVNVPVESQAAIIATPIAITGALVGAIGKLPFLIGFLVVLMVLFSNPATAPFGIVLLLVVGIPALFVLGTGLFLVFQNFTLIIILIAGFSILKLVLGNKVEKQVSK